MTRLRYPIPCAAATLVTNQGPSSVTIFEESQLIASLAPGQTMRIPVKGSGEIEFDGESQVTATTLIQECDQSFEPPPATPTGEFLL